MSFFWKSAFFYRNFDENMKSALGRFYSLKFVANIRGSYLLLRIRFWLFGRRTSSPYLLTAPPNRTSNRTSYSYLLTVPLTVPLNCTSWQYLVGLPSLPETSQTPAKRLSPIEMAPWSPRVSLQFCNKTNCFSTFLNKNTIKQIVLFLTFLSEHTVKPIVFQHMWAQTQWNQLFFNAFWGNTQ